MTRTPDLSSLGTLAAIALAIAVILIVVAMFPIGDAAIVVLGVAFLVVCGSATAGLVARHGNRGRTPFGNEMAAYFAVVGSVFVACFFWLIVAAEFFPGYVVQPVFWVMIAVWAMYALATAAPAIRVAAIAGVVVLIPLTLAVILIVQSRDRARRTDLENRARETGAGTREWLESKPK